MLCTRHSEQAFCRKTNFALQGLKNVLCVNQEMGIVMTWIPHPVPAKKKETNMENQKTIQVWQMFKTWQKAETDALL